MKKLTLLLSLCVNSVMNSQADMFACYPLDCDNAQNVIPNNQPGPPGLNGIIPVDQFAVPYVTCTTGHLNLPNTAYSFAGNVNSYIELPNHPKGGSICVSGWYYINIGAPAAYLIYTRNNSTTCEDAYSLIWQSTTATFGRFWVRKYGAGGCGQLALQQSTPFITMGAWHHVVFYIDNSKIWLYVDNIFQGQINVNFGFDFDPAKSVILGGSNEPANLPFLGAMDDLKFYNNELSPTEVSGLYLNSPQCALGKMPVGIRESINRNSGLTVFPNPSTGKFSVENSGALNFRITDLTGIEIAFDQIQNENKTEISIQEKKSGLYILNVFSKDGILLESKKLSVE